MHCIRIMRRFTSLLTTASVETVGYKARTDCQTALRRLAMPNTTSYTPFNGIDLCTATPELCIPLVWHMVLLLLHSVTLLANGIHLAVLRKLQLHQQKLAYYIILCYMSLTDIVHSLTAIFQFSCWFRTTVTNQTGIFIAFFSALVDSSLMMPYLVLTAASFERYIAICKPYSYKTNKLVNNIGKLLLCSHVLTVGLCFARNLVFIDDLCIDSIKGPRMRSLKESSDVAIGMTCTIFLSVVVLVFTLYKVLRELQLMKKRSMSEDERDISKAAEYIFSIIIAFTLCLLPLYICIIMVSIGVVVKAFIWASQFGSGLYGLANVAVYGWMYSSYRSKLKEMITCKMFSDNVVFSK